MKTAHKGLQLPHEGRDEEGMAISTDEVMIKRVVLKQTIGGGA